MEQTSIDESVVSGLSISSYESPYFIKQMMEEEKWSDSESSLTQQINKEELAVTLK